MVCPRKPTGRLSPSRPNRVLTGILGTTRVNLSIPAEMMKQPGVTVALRYKTTKKAATWEVKNFKVMKGNGEENPGGGEGGDKPVEPDGKKPA